MLGQYAAAVQVLTRTDLLGVLPRRFVQASGGADGLHLTALPFEMPLVEVGLLWHRRHERDAGQRWLRETVKGLAPDDG
jgi:DNA-binding transcriptional LysR family regulator